MNENECLNEMENLFLALSDKTRLRILNLMRDDEVCVYYFTEILRESQPKISRHLAYLKNAGIVSARRAGKWIYYRIAMPKNVYGEKVLQDTIKWLADQESMRKEYESLLNLSPCKSESTNTSQENNLNIFDKTNVRYIQREELETFLL